MKQFVSENLDFLKDFAAENKFKSFKYTAFFIILFTTGLLISPGIIDLFESQMPFDMPFSQTSPESMFLLSVLLAFDFSLLIISGFVFHNILKSNRKKLSLNDRNSQILLHIISAGLFWAGVFFAYFVLIPFILYLLLGFNNKLVSHSMDITKYISFCLMACFLTGIAFNVPVIRFVSTKTNYLDKKYLQANKINIITLTVLSLFLFTSIEAFKVIFIIGTVLLLVRLAELFSR
jgi:sec-independent protein translocase protein TatC